MKNDEEKIVKILTNISNKVKIDACDNFKTDESLKEYVSKSDSVDILKFVNRCSVKKYDINSKIRFLNQQHFGFKGNKASVIADTVMEVTSPEGKVDYVNFEYESTYKLGGANKITMYGFNIANTKVLGDVKYPEFEERLKIFPIGIVIMSANDAPKSMKAIDKIHEDMEITDFEVFDFLGNEHYKFEKGTLRLNYPCININKFRIDDYKDGFEILKVMALDKYRKNIELIKEEEEEFAYTYNKVNDYIETLNDEARSSCKRNCSRPISGNKRRMYK